MNLYWLLPFFIYKESIKFAQMSSSVRPKTRRLHESPYDKSSLVRFSYKLKSAMTALSEVVIWKCLMYLQRSN